MKKDKLLTKAEQVLTKTELNYFRMMYGQYLVPFLKGRPGTAKSAILKSIADKLDMVFIDLRLPTMDEIDLGVYPVVTTVGEGDSRIHELGHATPNWALMTADKKKNYLIDFEELNRASKPVRDAALGILNERRVGFSFVFGDNVFMAATGNMGTDDGTDVEEFDTALKSRLLTIPHDMDLAEWVTTWAEVKDANGKVVTQNVHADIVAFLTESPNYFYPSLKENEQKEIITNPRTWTALSTAIIRNFGIDSKVDDYGEFLRTNGKYYIGAIAMKLYDYANKNKPVTYDDVIKGRVKDYSKVKRDNRAEIASAIVSEGFDKLKQVELDRLIKFAKSMDADAIAGLVYKVGMETLKRAGEKLVLSKNDRYWAQAFKKELDYVKANQDAMQEAELKETTNEGSK